MGLNKIIKNLQEILDTKKSRQLKRIQTLEDLLRRLEKKEQKFIGRLETVEDEKEIKRINRRIKVCRAQRKKGQDALNLLHKKDKTTAAS